MAMLVLELISEAIQFFEINVFGHFVFIFVLLLVCACFHCKWKFRKIFIFAGSVCVDWIMTIVQELLRVGSLRYWLSIGNKRMVLVFWRKIVFSVWFCIEQFACIIWSLLVEEYLTIGSLLLFYSLNFYFLIGIYFYCKEFSFVTLLSSFLLEKEAVLLRWFFQAKYWFFII